MLVARVVFSDTNRPSTSHKVLRVWVQKGTISPNDSILHSVTQHSVHIGRMTHNNLVHGQDGHKISVSMVSGGDLREEIRIVGADSAHSECRGREYGI